MTTSSSSTRFSTLLREPALLLDLAETLLVAFIAFGLPVSGDQQSYLIAALVALAGLAKAFVTRPFAVAALTDFGRALLVVVASFGVGLSADQIAILVTLLGTITTVVIRGQITPRNSPVIAQSGAGSGPVSGEAGYATLATVGAVLVAVAAILLVTTLLKVFVVAIPILVITFVIGVALVIFGGGAGGNRVA